MSTTLPTEPEILDVTLRDGSYLIDFQFTASDTARLASALEAAGFRWIEVGHGLGIGASREGKGAAAATDEAYIEAASEHLSHATCGVFCIPGIATLDDLRQAAGSGAGFVRIGTNVTEVDSARPFLELGKELGLTMAWNGMKSYAIAPSEFARLTAQVRAWGADLAYLVDSAGGMLPEEVATYLSAAKAESDVALGFHGHDNLSLATANSLSAVKAGALFVDSSLQGMGRSAGNAITETLVALFKQRGLARGIDLNAVLDLGDSLIRPLLRCRGLDPISITAGYARFHSSYQERVQAFADRHGVDVRDLIVRLCSEDQITAPDGLLERLSRELATEALPRVLTSARLPADESSPASGRPALSTLIERMHARARKLGKLSVLNLVRSGTPTDALEASPHIHSSSSYVIGSATFSSDEQLQEAASAAERRLDIVLLDVDARAGSTPARTAKGVLGETLLLTYLDRLVWTDAVESQCVRLLGETLEDAPVVIAGLGSDLLVQRLRARGAQVTVLSQSGAGDPIHAAGEPLARERIRAARLLVSWPCAEPWLSGSVIEALPPGATVLDARIGGLTAEAIAAVRERRLPLLRVNIWPTLVACLCAAHETHLVTHEAMGQRTLGGIAIVAGGAVGSRGDVVVDHITTPRRVVGIADGAGGLSAQPTAEELGRASQVEHAILEAQLRPRATGA